MSDDSATLASEILFNKFAVQAARRKALVQSWMVGATEQYSQSAEDSVELEEDGAETFNLKPELELAGLGVDIKNLSEAERIRLDPEARHEDASTAFLRERLLGKKGGAAKASVPVRSNIALHGLEPGFTPSRFKHVSSAGTESTSKNDLQSSIRQPQLGEDDDDDDEVGRSGLGGSRSENRPEPRKKKKKGMVGSMGLSESVEPTRNTVDTTVKGSQKEVSFSEGSGSDTESVKQQIASRPKSKEKVKKKTASYLDELLAQKSAKKQKRKS